MAIPQTQHDAIGPTFVTTEPRLPGSRVAGSFNNTYVLDPEGYWRAEGTDTIAPWTAVHAHKTLDPIPGSPADLATRPAVPQPPAAPDPLAPGTWVRVWGQTTSWGHHPDDIVIEFHAHGEDWTGHIRRDHVEPADSPPPFAPTCASLRRLDLTGREGWTYPEVWLRCDSHHGHPGDHRNGDETWTDTDAHIEVNR